MHIYSDDIGSITVSGPIVRIDLMIHAVNEQDSTKPKLVVQHQLIMPIDAFLRAAVRMQGVIRDFEKRGLIKQTKVDEKGAVTGQVGTHGEPLA